MEENIKKIVISSLFSWVTPVKLIIKGKGKMYFTKNYSMPENYTITWHSGAMDTVDNTLPSLKVALDAEADIAELDVSFLPDGTPVLIHDGAPTDTTLPKLDDALALTAQYEKTCLNLDLKSVAALKAIDALVKKHGLEKRVFFTGVGEDWIAAVKENTAIPYYLNVGLSPAEIHSREKTAAVAKKAAALGCIGINLHFSNGSPELIEAARAENMLVSLWTPSRQAELNAVFVLAPDNVTTKRPDLAYDLLGREFKG